MSSVSSFLTLLLGLCILMSLLLTLNIFHMLHNMKNAKILALYWKKERKKSKFNREQVEVFFLLNISPPPPPPTPEYNRSIKLCYVILILTHEYSMIISDFSRLCNTPYKFKILFSIRSRSLEVVYKFCYIF